MIESKVHIQEELKQDKTASVELWNVMVLRPYCYTD